MSSTKSTNEWPQYNYCIVAGQKSKLFRIREALKQSDTPVFAEIGRNYLPDKNGYWSQTVAFHLAPLKRMTGEQLDEFAKSLIPELDTTSFDKHDRSGRPALLYYDEVIGTNHTKVQREYTLKEPDTMTLKMTDAKDAKDGKWSNESDVTVDLRRRTWIYVYPDRNTASANLQQLLLRRRLCKK